jgi:hypothetical protein
MRLDTLLGTGKLIVQISPDIALVAGIGAHQLPIPMEVEGRGLPENSLVSLMGTTVLLGRMDDRGASGPSDLSHQTQTGCLAQ